MKYIYNIFGKNIELEIPFQIKIQGESVEFLSTADENQKEISIKIMYQAVEHLTITEEDGQWIDDRFYCENENEEKVYFTPYRGKEPFACVVSEKEDAEHITCFFRAEKISEMEYSHNVADMIGVENLLRKSHGFMLHSSFIRWNNKGILFSAPCGTGKSTQADLWGRYEEAEIINGDKAGIRKTHEGWKAYGLPHAGTSGIYRNESADIAAVIILRQAPENKITRLPMVQALSCIYSEIVMHRWDRKFTEDILTTLTEFVGEVPVYMLECRPDQGAVNLVKEVVTGEGN